MSMRRKKNDVDYGNHGVVYGLLSGHTYEKIALENRCSVSKVAKIYKTFSTSERKMRIDAKKELKQPKDNSTHYYISGLGVIPRRID